MTPPLKLFSAAILSVFAAGCSTLSDSASDEQAALYAAMESRNSELKQEVARLKAANEEMAEELAALRQASTDSAPDKVALTDAAEDELESASTSVEWY